MSRRWNILNLGGVLLLLALCCVQWEANRFAQLQVTRSEAQRLALGERLQAAEKTMAGDAADLNEFRMRLAATDQDARDAQAKLAADADKIRQISAERDQHQAAAQAEKIGIDQWKGAVAARDNALKQAGEAAKNLAAERNEAIQKYNDLVTRFNAAAATIEQAERQIQKLAAERDDAVQRFNALAVKYNALVQGKSPATQR